MAGAWVVLDEGQKDAGCLELSQEADRDSLSATVVTAVRALELERKVKLRQGGWQKAVAGFVPAEGRLLDAAERPAWEEQEHLAQEHRAQRGEVAGHGAPWLVVLRLELEPPVPQRASKVSVPSLAPAPVRAALQA